MAAITTAAARTSAVSLALLLLVFATQAGAATPGLRAWIVGVEASRPSQRSLRPPASRLCALGRSPDEIWLTIASGITLFCIPRS